MNEPTSTPAAREPADSATKRFAPRELTIAVAADCHRQWAAAHAAGELTVDLAQVERCDAFGLQLLGAARRAGATRPGSVRIEHASAVVQATAAEAGVPLAALVTEPA